MNEIDQRVVLERLIRDQRLDYAALSRLLGRNPAYIQQFIKRGSPRRLADEDRRRLARFFGVDERELGGPSGQGNASLPSRLIAVPRLNISASAGPGAFADDERAFAHIAFDETWLRKLIAARPSDLSLIEVEGDSMAPTLSDGDVILVNTGDGIERLRDGIYVLRRDDTLLVKRIARSPASQRISIQSDNPNYPSWMDCQLTDIDIIGRVAWFGRQLT